MTSETHDGLPFRQKVLVIVVVVAGVLLVDLVTKALAESILASRPTYHLLGDTVRIGYALNAGVFLSLGHDLSPQLRFWLFVVGVGGVDQAPVFVDLDGIHQKLDRPPAVRGEAILDLAGLFADMDVGRLAAPGRGGPFEIVEGEGAQRVRCDADAAAGRPGFHQARIGIAVVEEAALGRRRRLSTKAALPIEHRQQRQADAHVGGGRNDALGHLGYIVVRPPVGLVMQVVELGRPGEARLEHLHVSVGGDRLEVVGRQPLDEAIHLLAPGPERIGLGAAPGPPMLGEAGHGALEGVAVQVGQARHPARFEVQFTGHDEACTVSGRTC